MADDDLIFDWDKDWDRWMRYVGPKVREVWASLPYDLRDRIFEDACTLESDDWNNSIDAMGEDA